MWLNKATNRLLHLQSSGESPSPKAYHLPSLYLSLRISLIIFDWFETAEAATAWERPIKEHAFSKLSNIVLSCSNSTGESWQGHKTLHKWMSVVWSNSSKHCVTTAAYHRSEAIKAQREKHLDDAVKLGFLYYCFYLQISRVISIRSNITMDQWHVYVLL